MNLHTRRARFGAAIAIFACMAASPAAALDEQPAEKRAGPVFSSCAKPVWPKESLRAREQGAVTLQFLIGSDGSVRKSRVLESSGFPLLDNAAQTALAACKFTPAMVNGVPAEAYIPVKYVWTLNSPVDQAKTQQGADAAAAQ
jgi:uncharacterized protein